MSTVTNTPAAVPAHAPALQPWGRSLSVIALLLIAAAMGLRLYHLGQRSLWYDEAVTANASQGTLKQVLVETRHFSAPIGHPYLLFLVEKVESTPVAVRMPSVLASLLAVLLMLATATAGIRPEASIFAATILTFSASQIRYAQEVREYSLAVLLATLLIYLFLRWETAGFHSRQPWLLYLALFFAPLAQYGLVVFSGAILIAIAARLLWGQESRFRVSHLAFAAVSLGLGSIASFLLTLRYQFHAGGSQWYLAADYFNPQQSSLLRFLSRTSAELLQFLVPGHMLDLLIVLAIVVLCVSELRRRTMHTALLVTLLSIGITMAAAVARIYPFGGMRQCLFLAPGIALIAGLGFAEMVQWLKAPWQRNAATAAVMVVIVFSLYRGTLKQWPYGEYEDIRSVLSALNRGLAPQDQVFINHDAVPAVRFYQRTDDGRFRYGKYHPNAHDYIPELDSFVDPHTHRVWLVFSHLQQASDRAEEQLIVNSLRPGWNVQSVAAPKNTELYLACRRAE